MLSVLRNIAVIAPIAAFLAPAAIAADQKPSSIEVFTTSEYPAHDIQEPGVMVYEVDGLDQLTASLSKNLPADEKAAKHEALKRIARLGDELRWTVEHAVEGMTRAQSYDLKQLPAVVFDKGSKVVYGITDVNKALGIYLEAAVK